MNKAHSIAIISCFLVLCSFKDTGYRSHKIRTIVIDAGHGGHDPGNTGTKTRKQAEKDVALSIALRLGEYITLNIKDVRVIYTRDKDVFVELRERAAIANRKNADFFLSIHCNSGNTTVSGTETFIMGLHKTQDNLEVSKRENASILLEKDYIVNYEGYDPQSPEANIIFEMFQNSFQQQSLLLASKIENQFKTRPKHRSRGVKQAGFLVLYKTAMPSILIETGFLTNHEEEKYLHTPEGQDFIAGSIFKAFRDYKSEIEAKAR